ncbi:MAG: VapC toxin family PIN domain ribonuclease [Gammaproteobacteria bacterium]|nr:VapC toxin family PIN domain ribonuclease [Gammaproteobacteria bacterium]
MILVDTSVWIDNVRSPIHELSECVAAGEVLAHDMVIGELACGNLPDRESFLRRLRALPALPTLASADVLGLIEAHAWMGRGIGYVDANLLGSVLAQDGASLWTADRRLKQIADELGIAHTKVQSV